MKKLFSIFLFSLMVLGSANAQVDTLFTEDFHAGINPAWADNGTANGVANAWAKWRYTHSGSHGAYGSPTDFIASPTAANGFIIFDSDSLDNGGVAGAFGLGPAPAPQTAVLTSSAIDITGHPYCQLNFYQYYRNFTSTTVVGISTDSVNWVLDTINTTIAVNQNTSHSSQINIDISPVVLTGGPGGTPSNKVYISFIMDANYYFWMVDDISITTLANNDLSIVQSACQSGTSGLGLFYSSIPVSQADSFVAVTQYGTTGPITQTNTAANFKLLKNGAQVATYTTTPAVAALPYGIDTIGFASFNNTYGIGQYIVAVHVTADSASFYPGPTYDTIKYAVTDSVYSINTTKVQNANSYFLLRNNAGASFMLGSLFEIGQQDTVTSITTAVAGGSQGTHAGAVIQGHVYPITVTPTALQYNTPVVSTYTRTLSGGDISSSTIGANVTPVTMMIDNSSGNAVLSPGLYWAAIEGISTPDSNILICSTNFEKNGFPVVEQSSTLYFLSNTDAAYCNMNLGHPSSLLYCTWTRTPATTPLHVGQAVTFTGTSNGSPSTVYNWTITDVTSGTTYPNLTGRIVHDTMPPVVNSVDSFYVCLSVTDGSVTSPQVCKWVIVRADGTGIEETSALNTVNMVPNPTTGRVSISAEGVQGSLSISVVNMLGETVRNYHEEASGSFTKTFDLSALSTGVYLIKLENAGSTITKRLSITRQ